MDTVKASEFKAKCLSMMDEVARTGKPLVVTKNGKPVVEVRRHSVKGRRPLGIWKDRVRIKGDIISPLEMEWEALK